MTNRTFDLKLAFYLGVLAWLHIRHDLAAVVAAVLQGALADLEHAFSLRVRPSLLVPRVGALKSSILIEADESSCMRKELPILVSRSSTT